MSEPSHRPPLSITLHDVRTGPPHEGERGEGVMLLTDLGKAPMHGWRKGCVTNRSPRCG